MADVKCIPVEVQNAEKTLYGEMAQAQSLVELYMRSNDDSPYSCLSSAAMERLCDAVDAYRFAVCSMGHPSQIERSESAESAQ